MDAELDAPPLGAGVKRVRDEAAAAAAAPSSSSSSSSSEVPAALRTPAAASAASAAPAPLVRLSHAEHFNTPLLKFYYQHLFPFKQMTRWLSYGNGACRPLASAGPAADRFVERASQS